MQRGHYLYYLLPALKHIDPLFRPRSFILHLVESTQLLWFIDGTYDSISKDPCNVCFMILVFHHPMESL